MKIGKAILFEYIATIRRQLGEREKEGERRIVSSRMRLGMEVMWVGDLRNKRDNNVYKYETGHRTVVLCWVCETLKMFTQLVDKTRCSEL